MTGLTELLDLEEVDLNLYRTRHVLDEPFTLYGGQVAAQALWAASRTVQDLLPHSLHGYFLRAGDPTRPIVFRVERDRDGRSYSARRVVALQGGEVLFNLACSFHVAETGLDLQLTSAPDAGDPAGLPETTLPRLVSIEARMPPQPYEDAVWLTRFWARCTEPLPDDPTLHACVLTYLSDICTGLSAVPGAAGRAGSSLDHALWFHRPARMDDWVLTDLVPVTVSRGRGTYTGSMYDRQGTLIASLAQETLFRDPR